MGTKTEENTVLRGLDRYKIERTSIKSEAVFIAPPAGDAKEQTANSELL